MFEGLLKPKFVAKCKGAVKLTKTRIDAIRKKRRAVEKFMKSDIAELLWNGQDYNAYGRAEGLLIEQDRTACYELIDQYCSDVLKNLSVMQKQIECPEECREAVASMIYSAARISDLPELRDLRTLFTEKYGKSIEPFVSQELVQKLKGERPAKETKLQLMHDIAHESGIEWDSKALEQRLFKPPSAVPQQVDGKHQEPGMDVDDENINVVKSKKAAFQKRDNKASDVSQKETDLTSHRSSNGTENKHRRCRSSDNEVNEANQDSVLTCSSSTGSISEDDALDRKLFGYRLVPPPYVKANVGKERNTNLDPAKPRVSSSEDVPVAETRPKPRSVRRRNSKLNIEWENSSTVESTEVLKTLNQERRDQREKEEEMMDDLLMHYSSKPSSHYEPMSQHNANLKLPRGRKDVDDNNAVVLHRRNTTFESSARPERTKSFPTEQTSPAENARGHVRAASLQPEMLAKHVHPRLPDYDDLAAQLAALRGR